MDQGAVRHGYQTSVDRAGYAILAGGVLCGAIAAGLLALGGQGDPMAIATIFMIGSVLSSLAVTAIAAPIWLVMHLSGRRKPRHAMLVGAVTGFLVFAAGQTYGFGLGDAPVSDAATVMMRWLSAAATSLILAVLSAIVGLVMWRVAYRRAR